MACQRRRQPTLNAIANASDPDESKRVANGLAQRKFRRQRRDYIAHLEQELALCRESATGELVHRRQEIARLNQEKTELRDLENVFHPGLRL
ncbi:hypothetical protein ACJBU6_09001 [Exserohilum turcicum]